MKILMFYLEDVKLDTEKLRAALSLTRWKVISTYFERELQFLQSERRDRGAWYVLLITADQPNHVKPSNLFKLQLPISSRFSCSGQDHLKLVFSLVVAIEAVLAYFEGLLDYYFHQCFHISNSRKV